MSDLVMLSVLCGIFVFFLICMHIIRTIAAYININDDKIKLRRSDIIILLFSELTCVICMILSFFNIINYLIL